MTADDNALTFILKHKEELFPNGPVVFFGVNNIAKAKAQNNNKDITGVVEAVSMNETIEMMIGLKPKASKVVALVDTTPSGQGDLINFKEASSYFPDLTFSSLSLGDYSFTEFKAELGKLGDDTVVLLLSAYVDKNGKRLLFQDSLNLLLDNLSQPLFHLWNHGIGDGLLGGKVISHEQQGKTAAQIVDRILDGEPVGQIGVVEDSPNRYVLDYRVLEKFGLGNQKYPANTFLLHKPESFYDRHKRVIVPSLTVILLLSGFMLLLLQNLIKQKALNRKDKAIIGLNHEIIDTQRELVTILGEVIENHSKETGNHVKRVAKISRFLGTKIGLSDTDLELLEAASPLHDVGKIGISDKILHKPGKLTSKEFEVIKEHTTIGKEILGTSGRQLLASACSIAYQHHERWDGTGYPNGLKGEKINIFARITMLADIYDALSSRRHYKKAWPEPKVLEYVRNENRKFFDPQLVAVFLENIDEIRAIRTKYLEEKNVSTT